MNGGNAMVDVAAGLLFSGGKLLIAQRPPGTHLAGLWEFPGGKVVTGETWEQCLTRELQEELGVEVEPGSLYEEIVHAYPAKTVRLRFFVCTSWRGEPRPIECAALAWITRAELSNYTFPPADERLISRLAREAWPA
ncbi:MAG TPA: 8-oxo-dGTP diphosphatase MutT [Candidatus Limnocylindria bacterium]|jgi:mutator protein MutT|nr:8-oxo-dGTP diphosphatase MutT [Candidatus Limnocylindria bacterium]